MQRLKFPYRPRTLGHISTSPHSIPLILAAFVTLVQAASADTPSSRPLIITNQCSDTIYPGILTQAGEGPADTGFKLDPGVSHTQSVSEAWEGRVWGRTNCSFNTDGTLPANNTPGKACLTGDCAGSVSCKVSVSIVTVLQISCDSSMLTGELDRAMFQ
jgi:hypothetical protein